MKLRKILLLIFLSAVVFSCGSRQNKVQRIVEDGVEVVLNPLEPYKIKGTPSGLGLEQLFIIDFESDGLAGIGIRDISGFDVDSQGNIYIWVHDSSEYFIFKFDEKGNYIKSFGRYGQGPGELDYPVLLRIDDRNQIIVAEARRLKLVVWDADGELTTEIEIPRRYFPATRLENEKILAVKSIPVNEEGMAEKPIIISSPDFESISLLHPGEQWPNWVRAKSMNGLKLSPPLFPPWYISNGLIFIANQNNGYEILIYDFNGHLQKKIRKQYEPVLVPEQVKEEVLKYFDRPRFEESKNRVYFPEFMPPFQYFFVDEEGRVFVMTNEPEGENRYRYDIFNPDGVFIGRSLLDNHCKRRFGDAWADPLPVEVQNGRLYYLRGKDSGYFELVVCRMIWAN